MGSLRIDPAKSAVSTILERGSLQEAGRLCIANARGSTESKVENIRIFTDLLSGQLLELGGPAVSAVGGQFVDAAWGQLADRAENQARVDVEDRIGGLSDLAQIFRSAMGGLETHLINAFDDRLDQYFDG